MDTIAKTKTPCTSFDHAVARIVHDYFQNHSNWISLVSKEYWPDKNRYFVDYGITEAALRRVLNNWPGPGWIEFVPSSYAIWAVWRDSQ